MHSWIFSLRTIHQADTHITCVDAQECGLFGLTDKASGVQGKLYHIPVTVSAEARVEMREPPTVPSLIRLRAFP